jgi:hypothetical protein
MKYRTYFVLHNYHVTDIYIYISFFFSPNCQLQVGFAVSTCDYISRAIVFASRSEKTTIYARSTRDVGAIFSAFPAVIYKRRANVRNSRGVRSVRIVIAIA